MLFLPLILLGAAFVSTAEEEEPEQFGVIIGRGGQISDGGRRGGRGRSFFTRAEIDAYNREGAAQGLRGASVAPTAGGPFR